MSAKRLYQRHTSARVPFARSFSWRDDLPEAAVNQLARHCAAHDGARNRDDSLQSWGWLEEQGQAAVLLGLQGDLGKLELHVAPECRGQGWGSWLLQAGLRELGRQGAACVDVWAYGDVERSVSWLRRQGFESRRLLFSLLRPAEPAQEVRWPAGWQVRPLASGDESSWHELHCRMQSDPRLAWSRERLEQQLADPLTPPAEFWLLWEQHELRGYAWLKSRAELFMFALAPECRGQGMGRRLLQHALGRCPGEVQAFCDEARSAALGLLRSSGFRERGRDRCLRRSL